MQHQLPPRVAMDPTFYSQCIRLITITILYGAALVGSAPILGPDLSSCRMIIPPGGGRGGLPLECCILDRRVVDFKFDPNLPMRERRPIHLLDDEFVKKYERAYELMRALPREDPRSWLAQSKMHCSYTTNAYFQTNASEPFDVHLNWLFSPFHRWFLYFHERILATLIGDDTFAVPYWAWDMQDPEANSVPAIFSNPNSSLYDVLRSRKHIYPHPADLVFNPAPDRAPRDKKIVLSSNMHTMWSIMVGDTKTPESFHGGPLRLGDPYTDLGARVETGPHAAVHSWIGSDDAPRWEDMGPAYTAARDPIFWTHHSQVERLWEAWKELGGRDFEDPDWLNSEFYFYDENANLVRVNIRDSLDLSKLRVKYMDSPRDWLNYTPGSSRGRGHLKFLPIKSLGKLWRYVVDGLMAMERMGEMLGAPSISSGVRTGGNSGSALFSRKSKKTLTLKLGRPHQTVKTSLEDSSTPKVEEVLVIRGLVKKPDEILHAPFDVFLELAEADENTPLDCLESLGRINVQRGGTRVGDISEELEFTRQIGLRKRLDLLNISSQTTLLVTFVPAWDPQHDSAVSVELIDVTIKLQTLT